MEIGDILLQQIHTIRNGRPKLARFDSIQDMIGIQQSLGWQKDEYMHGMLNGMQLIQSVIHGDVYCPVTRLYTTPPIEDYSI